MIERDADGKAIRLFGAHIDVTDQVEAERSIRQREQEFRTLAEALPHHVWTATSDGSFNWFNRRFYDYVGARPGELSGKDWSKIVHPEDASAAAAARTRAVNSSEPYEIEFRLRRSDGSYHWFLSRAVPARDDDGRITRWIGTNTDVHDQKRIAAKARRAERDACRARRGKNPRARPDLERVPGLAARARTARHLALRQPRLDQDARLERGRVDGGVPPNGSSIPKISLRPELKSAALRAAKKTVRFENRLRHKDGLLPLAGPGPRSPL